ncbi:MAG: ABC transporter ATP-binding protein [Acidimicrobiales bacterium]
MKPAIEIAGLRKEYRNLRRGRRRVALDGLDLSVPEGGVFGFLGPNGSGKTTTIRCLLGLVHPSAGSAFVLGAGVPGDLHTVIARIGSIVETPTFFPTMSARRNLSLLGRLDGHGAREVAAVLARVGLGGREDDLVKGYSLGLRQRLGLAAALLKDPALLILDEPANGLDPAGIREIRVLLRELAAEGRTILLSSHLLGEIEVTCDRVAILDRGRAVAVGTVHDVLAGAGADALLVRVDDPGQGQMTLSAAGFDVVRQQGHLRVAAPASAGAEVTRTLAASGQWVAELRVEEKSLEDLFLELTADSRSFEEVLS